MRHLLLLAPLAGLLALAGCARQWPPGMIAPAEPLQVDFTGAVHGHSLPDAVVTPLAAFDITARVLSAKGYRFDREARYAPVDLALGWGPMSDTAVLKHISITQIGRLYLWSSHDPPIAPDEIATHSANMHIVPANAAVRSALGRVRAGDRVHIVGELIEIDADGEDGWHWASSLSRTDTGDGACELVWAEQLTVE